jgi:hypothetical protein
MTILDSFAPPAYQDDFINGEEKQRDAFLKHWSDNLNTFVNQTRQNNPWSSLNQPALTEYFNPLETDIPAGAALAPVLWTAFPRRIQTIFPNVGQRKQWQYADEGPPNNGNPGQPYQPQGPRGWQDEYCEWSVTRDPETNKITKVSFTCENREYWYTLWDTDPEVVLRQYHEIVGPEVKLEDLYLRDANGGTIVDPETGRPAYNGRNRFNNTTSNGAVHLISNPNALSAEIFLAGQATILRKNSEGKAITDRDQLIECSRYGTPNRNSDPTIGSDVNTAVRGGSQVSLHNPVGLYIQTPDFSRFQLPFSAPGDAKPSDYWTVVRGIAKSGEEPIDFILHAVYEVPDDQNFTVSDITIDGHMIDYGSQITETFQIGLVATVLPQVGPSPQMLKCAKPSPNPLPRPYVLRDIAMLPAAYRSGLAARIELGQTQTKIALIASNSSRGATIEILGGGISVRQTGFEVIDSDTQLFVLEIMADDDAMLGPRSLLLTNPNGDHGPAVFGMLQVVAKGTLAQSSESLSRKISIDSRTSDSMELLDLKIATNSRG